jgi:hypothetical protein
VKRCYTARPENIYGEIVFIIPIAPVKTFKFHKDGSQPTKDQIFVFGSNKAGVHGAGAARAAYEHYGARWGCGWGFTGSTFAIPTKDYQIISMKIDEIRKYASLFVGVTHSEPFEEFFVTRIGCGLAGYTDAEIAPLFKECNTNCSFANEWAEFLK